MRRNCKSQGRLCFSYFNLIYFLPLFCSNKRNVGELEQCVRTGAHFWNLRKSAKYQILVELPCYSWFCSLVQPLAISTEQNNNGRLFEKKRPKIGLKWCASCAISRSYDMKVQRFQESRLFWDIKKCSEICFLDL